MNQSSRKLRRTPDGAVTAFPDRPVTNTRSRRRASYVAPSLDARRPILLAAALVIALAAVVVLTLAAMVG